MDTNITQNNLGCKYFHTCCFGGTRGAGIDVGISSVESLLNKRISRPPEEVLGVLSSLFVLRKNCNLSTDKALSMININNRDPSGF